MSHLFSTTLSSALPTSLPGTASAISSTQVTCSAWAAGLGNSLNLQSQLGKGPGDLPAMGERELRRSKGHRRRRRRRHGLLNKRVTSSCGDDTLALAAEHGVLCGCCHGYSGCDYITSGDVRSHDLLRAALCASPQRGTRTPTDPRRQM